MQKAFEMIKKLKTDRKLLVKNNTLYISSKEGKFKAQLIDKQKPNITLEKFEYINTYDLNVLKRAATFASTNQARIMFTGVLFNELGGMWN